MTERIYCDECTHLVEKDVLVDVKAGNYKAGFSTKTTNSGKRFYCQAQKKWLPINSNLNEIGFGYCEKGEKKP